MDDCQQFPALTANFQLAMEASFNLAGDCQNKITGRDVRQISVMKSHNALNARHWTHHQLLRMKESENANGDPQQESCPLFGARLAIPWCYERERAPSVPDAD